MSDVDNVNIYIFDQPGISYKSLDVKLSCHGFEVYKYTVAIIKPLWLNLAEIAIICRQINPSISRVTFKLDVIRTLPRYTAQIDCKLCLL